MREWDTPFSEGNERLGLYWQQLLLVQWRPILAALPFESVVTERQEEYRRVLAYLNENAKMTHFIEFILRCLLDTILQEVKNKVENKVKNKSRGKVQDKSAENAESEDTETQLSKSEQRIVKLLASYSLPNRASLSVYFRAAYSCQRPVSTRF